MKGLRCKKRKGERAKRNRDKKEKFRSRRHLSQDGGIEGVDRRTIAIGGKFYLNYAVRK